jgi:CubicO group peptidase (beta-lactamase class C family)
MKRFLFCLAALGACQTAGGEEQTPERVPSEAAFVEAQTSGDGEVRVVIGGQGTAGALYQLGSISKFACTLAALDLAHEGKLDLDEPVGTYLDDYRSPAAQQLTLRQLMGHRANLVDGFVAAFQSDPSVLDDDITAAEAVNRFASAQTRIMPGAAFSYTISNWIVVQAVLEEVTGDDVANVLHDRIFDPADIEGIEAYHGRLDPDRTVEPVSPVPAIPSYLVCAGGVAATAEGLLQLARWPIANSGWPAALVGELTEVRSPEENYALGGRVWAPGDDGTSPRFLWLGGSNGAFKSRAVVDLEDGAGFAIVTASDDNALVDGRRSDWLGSTYPALASESGE